MNILAVGAHYDDIELGCSGALIKHVLQGDNVLIYVATHSGFVSPGGKTIRDKAVAQAEGEIAAKLIGGTLINGGFETLNLEFTDELNGQLVALIEKYDIDIIYSHYSGDIHHDHQALAKAVLHAGRHVPRILEYHSNWYLSEKRFSPNFFVDISDTWETKKSAIMCHESEFKRAGKDWLRFFENEAINNGFICGVFMAEGFKVVKWLM